MSLRKKLYYDLRVTSLGISLNGAGTLPGPCVGG